jgi:predicted type IV restriction endonuclease
MLVMITSRTFHEVSICALKVGWKINCYSSEWLVTDMLEEGKKKKKKLITTP